MILNHYIVSPSPADHHRSADQDQQVELALPHLPPPVRCMVHVQLLCGGRPQDMVELKPCDIDRSGPVWEYRPHRHTAGTAIRKQYGLEASQAVLGHAELGVTPVYAEKDLATARQVMAEIGRSEWRAGLRRATFM